MLNFTYFPQQVSLTRIFILPKFLFFNLYESYQQSHDPSHGLPNLTKKNQAKSQKQTQRNKKLVIINTQIHTYETYYIILFSY
ncbi:hypothetical protein L2E82_02776 [Cichorium intybus]|uniref:Uncharacterized protein n=1 Tax=Cichorium intybus TaxID=13427 RepID=A0ACB9H297_CICIN|nr:hypothetical protein L2E82_02776 [Cichorium intybus]